MFRRFVQPHCKNLKILCMFLIMLQSSKSGVASSWCCQIWDLCGNTFFTFWRSTSWPWKSFFSLFPLEIHFWGVPGAKNAVQPNSYIKLRGHLILNFRWPVWWNSKSFFSLFPIEIHFWGVPEAKSAVQLNSYLKGRSISFWIFSDQFHRIPIAGWPSTCKKNVLPHISQIWRHQLLATPLLLDWSMVRNIHRVFKFLQCGRTNLLNILPVVVYFSIT